MNSSIINEYTLCMMKVLMHGTTEIK